MARKETTTRKSKREPQPKREPRAWKCDRSQPPGAEPAPGEKLADAAARLRNILDQKTGREKQILKRYVSALELQLSRKARRKH